MIDTRQVFIDASYEGDLLARYVSVVILLHAYSSKYNSVGVEYTVGREGPEQYNESLAGSVIPNHSNQFTVGPRNGTCADIMIKYTQ